VEGFEETQGGALADDRVSPLHSDGLGHERHPSLEVNLGTRSSLSFPLGQAGSEVPIVVVNDVPQRGKPPIVAGRKALPSRLSWASANGRFVNLQHFGECAQVRGRRDDRADIEIAVEPAVGTTPDAGQEGVVHRGMAQRTLDADPRKRLSARSTGALLSALETPSEAMPPRLPEAATPKRRITLL
jgi:hypothetical protein